MKLELRNIRLRMGDFALDLDAELKGEAIAIFGRNGAGKTTLLDLIAGLRIPDSGALSVDGKTWSDRSTRVFVPAQQRAIGYVPQEAALFPHLSVLRNITYGQHRAHSAASYNVSHLAEVLEISALMESRADSISGGEKQRVALARALASQPSLLLLDEPLSSLDGGIKAKGLELLMRIRNEFKIPMIYVSHSPDEILALCDRLLVLEQGRITRNGQPSEVFKPRKANVYEVD
jgi:molybdate transport system ATP-binding protein